MNGDYLLGMFAGVLLASIASSLVRYWRRVREQAKYDAAKKAIESHGLAVYSYLAAAGTEDEDLWLALDRVTIGSKVVLDAHGNVVGRVIPKVAHRVTEGVKLRLVVDNTKN